MHFGPDDVLARSDLNFDGGDFGAALLACSPLVKRLGISHLEVASTDPGGGWRGLNLTLRRAGPWRELADDVDAAVREALQPFLTGYGLSDMTVELTTSPTGATSGADAASVTLREPGFGPFTVFAVSSSLGGHEPFVVGPDGVRHPQLTVLPLWPGDIVARFHAVVEAGSLTEGARAAGALVGDASAWTVAVDRREQGGYDATVLLVVGNGPADEGALRRLLTPLVDRLGLAHIPLAVHGPPARPFLGAEARRAEGVHAAWIGPGPDPLSRPPSATRP